MNVILKKEMMIGGHLKKPGHPMTVTNGYGKELIRTGMARNENFIERLENRVEEKINKTSKKNK